MARRARSTANDRRVTRKQLFFETLEARLPLASDIGLDGVARLTQTNSPAVVAVYAPGTDPKILQPRLDTLKSDSKLGGGQISNFQFSDNSRWSSTATNGGGLSQGDPTTITWSIVPDGTPISGFNGEVASPSNLVSFLGSIYGVTTVDANLTDEPWFGLFQSYLNRWSALSGMTYVYEPADDGAALSFSTSVGLIGVRGDIRISGHLIDGNSNILAYNFFPNGGDMVIDTGDANFYGNTANNSRALRNVLAHENGHGLGMNHVCPVIQGVNGRLMEPFINLSIDGPQFDDILAIQRGYGDALEKNGGNDSAATARPLGTLGIGQTIVRGTDAVDIQVAPTEVDFISIDDDSDVDYFSFTIGSGMGANIELTPLGATYLSGAQNANGSCSAGTPFNASTQSDLMLQLIGPNGNTVLRTSNVSGLGGAEGIQTGFLSAGTYFVRISGTANAIQMYRLGIVGEQLTGVLITETGEGTKVSESGTFDTYSLALSTMPTGTVQVTVTTDGQSQVSSDGVNFANVAVIGLSDTGPQTLTVRAVDDFLGEGVHASLLTHAITVTGDAANYPLSLVIPSLTVDVLDNDLAQFTRHANLGSLIATSENNTGNLSGATDHADLNVLLTAGQTIAASVSSPSGALLSLSLVGVTSSPYESPSAGAAALLPVTKILTTANYTLRVSANTATTFILRAVLNAALEGVDSSPENELELLSSEVMLSPQALRLAAVGESAPLVNPLKFTATNNPSLFVDISASGNGVNLTDDSVTFISTTVGNSYFPAGTVTISNNGGIASGFLQSLDFLNVPLPTNQFQTALLPFWDDLDATNGFVYWQERTIGGVNALVVQWNNRPHFNTNNSTNGATFQVQVFENGPVLARFVYTDIDFGNPQFNSGVSATIGYQVNSTSAVNYSFDSATVTNGSVLELVAPIVPEIDEYEIDLTAQVNQPIDVVMTGISQDFSNQFVELLAPDGTTVVASGSARPLAVGVEATNLDVAILSFIVPAPGVYTVRVTSSVTGSYGLAVTEKLVFDVEPNNTATAPLRDLFTSGQSLGYLSAGSDSVDLYQLTLAQGEFVSIVTRTPFDALAATPGNNLDPELSLLASDGVTVLANNQNSASDGKNASLAFTAPITGTYLLRVASTSGSGEYTLMVGPGILVEQLYVNSTFWQPVFRDYLDGGFNDGTAAGFPVPFGYSSSIPWLGLNEIKMRFNSDVGNSLSASDFILTGRLGFDSNLAPGQVPTISNVTWNADTSMATLQLSDVVGPNIVTVTVVAAEIQTNDQVPMAANQSFRLFVLTGDTVDAHVATNGTYRVNGQDSTFVRDHLSGQLIDFPGNDPLDGAYFNYDMRADTNGDGRVNGVDSTVIRDRLSSFVVDLAPVVSSAVPVATSIRGIDEGQQLFSNTPQQFELQRSSQDVERIMPTRIVGATRLIAGARLRAGGKDRVDVSEISLLPLRSLRNAANLLSGQIAKNSTEQQRGGDNNGDR